MLLTSHILCKFFLTSPPTDAKYCDEHIRMSICHICQNVHVQTSQNFLYVLPVAVVRSFSDDNAIMLGTSGFVDVCTYQLTCHPLQRRMHSSAKGAVEALGLHIVCIPVPAADECFRAARGDGATLLSRLPCSVLQTTCPITGVNIQHYVGSK